MVRLLSAYGASSTAPVGLLVDAAGRDQIEGWSRLRQSVAAIPGVLLVGTARSEDLFTLGDLADCTTVRVALDEEAAATIHAGLVRRASDHSSALAGGIRAVARTHLRIHSFANQGYATKRRSRRPSC